jgi:prolyl-tRNA synthetase
MLGLRAACERYILILGQKPSMKAQKFGMSQSKAENFAGWYSEVIVKSEMLDYYDVHGCYIMRPQSMYVWKCIQKWFTERIEELGVQECYFPMLIPKTSLEREKNHVENFSPEVAWITHCGNEALSDPVAIRPTSETIMYPSFSKWILSHRDLPLKLNQWCNVLRWELRGTTPFIRGKEFLWQEGHTAFLKKEEADEEVLTILELYARVYTELLAIPVIKGKKSENEKFGGADYTTSIEAFIPGTGRAVQAATSHSLGTNFSRMFNISVPAEDGSAQYVYQNSWGLTTRSIGIATMIHSDDRGLMLPPRVAMIQVVVIMCGIIAKTSEADARRLTEYVREVCIQLKTVGVRYHLDDRSNCTVGYKFNHWEIRGVPIRIEAGFIDMEKGEVCLVRRDKTEKRRVSAEAIGVCIVKEINAMHNDMLERATVERDGRISKVATFEEFIAALEKKNIVLAPWCNDSHCEDEIKRKTISCDTNNVVIAAGAKSLCIPYEADSCDGMRCVNCEKAAFRYTLFGRSY